MDTQPALWHRRLPRLTPGHYAGRVFVHWSMTLEGRATGWLDPLHHARVRELLCHALARHQLMCAAYCLMPDHGHFLLCGWSGSSDQRAAVRLFRQSWNTLLAPGRHLQRQAHDHILREAQRERGAFQNAAQYILGNPARAGLVGLGDTISYEQRMKTLDEIGEQRTREFRGEARRDIAAIPEVLSDKDTENTREFFDYYRTPRGRHPRSTTSYSFTSLAPMMNYFSFAQIETISPRPVLLIVGERAVSAYFSEEAYSKAAQPKELFVVPGASHVDLYDRPQYMAVSLEKLSEFFAQNLSGQN